MNILFYLTRFPGIGGIENVTSIIIESLKAHDSIGGGNIVILSHMHSEEIAASPVPVFHMPTSKAYCSEENREYLEKVIIDNHIDKIIYQDSYAPTERMLMTTARRLKIPVIVFEHNSPKATVDSVSKINLSSPKEIVRSLCIPLRRRRLIKRKQYLIREAEKYVVLSPRFIPELLKLTKYRRYKDKIIAIPNPLRSYMRNDITKENTILFVGRLEKVKRMDLCLQAWKNLCDQLPEWSFVVVGDGSQRFALEKWATENKIERVRFEGFQDPTEYFEKSKVFWMTSDYEGWGLTLVEAQSAGCVPVVRDTFSSLHDIVTDENGRIIDSKSPYEFEQATFRLATDFALWHKLSERAKADAKRYNIESILPLWKDLLA